MNFKSVQQKVWVILWMIQLTTAAKVLLIPNSMYSVCLEVITVGEELLLKGHDVVVYQMRGFEKSCPGNNGMRLITYSGANLDLEQEMTSWQDFMESVFLGKTNTKTFATIKHLGDAQEKICRTALGDPVALKNIEMEQFDFVLIAGSTNNACYAVIPYKLNIPFAIESCHFTTWPNILPFMPHIAPDMTTEFTKDMTIMETAFNALAIMGRYFYTIYTVPMEHVKKYAPEMKRKAVVDLLTTAELYLENEDRILGHATPQIPRVVQVGGLLTKPANNLPEDIDAFLNKSTNGAILVSFGSSTLVPKQIDDKFTNVFSQLNVSVLWKHNKDETVGNIKKMKWLPQNDVLAHPNIRLMVYHCGKNGVYEALYHGVPLVCFPVMYDQPQMAARVKHWNVGITLRMSSFDSTEFRDAINEVAFNRTYQANMMKLSKIFHSTSLTPRQRAGYWLDHVITHGSAHLRSSGDNMPAYKHMMLDLYLFLFVGFLVLIKLKFWLFRKVYRSLRTCSRSFNKSNKVVNRTKQKNN